jgi:hypothetical protein
MMRAAAAGSMRNAVIAAGFIRRAAAHRAGF